MGDAGAGEHSSPDPPGPVIGEALSDARAERVGDNVEPIDPERRQQVIKRIGIIAAARRFGPQIVAQQIAWGIPGDQPEAIGEAGQLVAPLVGQARDWRARDGPPRSIRRADLVRADDAAHSCSRCARPVRDGHRPPSLRPMCPPSLSQPFLYLAFKGVILPECKLSTKFMSTTSVWDYCVCQTQVRNFVEFPLRELDQWVWASLLIKLTSLSG